MSKLIKSIKAILLLEAVIVAAMYGIKKLDEKLDELEKNAAVKAKEKFDKNFNEDVTTDKSTKNEVNEEKFKVQPITEDIINKAKEVKPVKKSEVKDKEMVKPKLVTRKVTTVEGKAKKALKPRAKKVNEADTKNVDSLSENKE